MRVLPWRGAVERAGETLAARRRRSDLWRLRLMTGMAWRVLAPRKARIGAEWRW